MALFYTLTIRDEAEEDIAGAVLWYLPRHPERIPRFLAALDACLAFILRNPGAPVRIERGFQQFPVKAFPYFVVYRLEGNEVVIARVFHMKRDAKTKLRRRRKR